MINKRVVVIGGGVAGMEAASNLAAFGINVDLIEKEPQLGGHVAQWDRLFPSRRPSKEITDYLAGKLPELVTVHTESEVVKTEQVGDSWHVLLNNGKTLNSDALLLATGFDLFEAWKKRRIWLWDLR